LIWIILTSIGIVCLIIITLALIYISLNLDDDWIRSSMKDFSEIDGIPMIISIMIIFFIVATVFTIWTVIIANKARKDIEQGVQLLPVVQRTGHNSQVTEAKINMGPNMEPGHPSAPHPSGPNSSAPYPSVPYPSASYPSVPHPSGIYSGQSPPPSYATALQASGCKD